MPGPLEDGTVWPVLVGAGVDTVREDPGNTVFTALAVGLLQFRAQWAGRHRIGSERIDDPDHTARS